MDLNLQNKQNIIRMRTLLKEKAPSVYALFASTKIAQHNMISEETAPHQRQSGGGDATTTASQKTVESEQGGGSVAMC